MKMKELLPLEVSRFTLYQVFMYKGCTKMASLQFGRCSKRLWFSAMCDNRRVACNEKNVVLFVLAV